MGKHLQTEHQKKNKTGKKIAIMNIIFLLATFLILFGFCIAILIRGQIDESIIENRNLNKFPTFSFKGFLEGKYQNNLEASLSDQMIMGQEIKTSMIEKKAETVNYWQGLLVGVLENEEEVTDTQNTNQVEEKKKEVRNIKYIPISNEVYHYGNSEYMVFKYRKLKSYEEKISKSAAVYNKRFANVDSYLYLVENSKAINFNTVDEEENEFLAYIKEKFTHFKCDGLKVTSYEQFKDYFYETDHHWNYKGSYQGYKDIINLLLPGEKVIEPTGTTTFDVYYYGSNARTTSIYTNKEKFTVYDY